MFKKITDIPGVDVEEVARANAKIDAILAKNTKPPQEQKKFKVTGQMRSEAIKKALREDLKDD